MCYQQIREQRNLGSSPPSRSQWMSWDVFISHASEDKLDIAEPLAKALGQAGLSVWYDDMTLTLGDSLRRSIDRGLRECRFGVVILSPSFFAKEWPQRELDGLVAREIDENKTVLPVWHNVTYKDVARFSPLLADKIAISTKKGVPAIVQSILYVVRPEALSSIDMEYFCYISRNKVDQLLQTISSESFYQWNENRTTESNWGGQGDGNFSIAKITNMFASGITMGRRGA